MAWGAVLALALGCSVVGQGATSASSVPATLVAPASAPPGASPGATPKVIVTEPPIPSVAPTTVTPEGTESPTQPPLVTSGPRDEHAAETFWAAVTAIGEYSRDYTTLSSITKDVDLIVRGNIVGLYPRDIQTTDSIWPSIWARFAITETLKGNPVSREPGFIDIVLSSNPSWSLANANVPDEELVLFLMNEEAYMARYGMESIEPDLEHFEYWRPNEQAVVRNVDGKTAVIDSEQMLTDYGADAFPLSVMGDDFDATVGAIRQSAAER